MKIYLAPYNPEWPKLFEKEKALIAAALADVNPVIEHIGSTSIPGLGAKPVIDMLIGLPDFSVADEQVPKMVALGYEYIDRWEDTVPNRRLFSKVTPEGVRTHNVHMIWRHDPDWWDRHIEFRDYLRQNDDVRDAYFDLKKKLAEQEWNEVNEYAREKTAFIRRIEAEARKALKG